MLEGSRSGSGRAGGVGEHRRYSFPLSAAAAVKVSVSEVAPAMSAKVEPPSVDTCHWTVGVGVPVAAAVNETDDPAAAVTFCGLAVTTGAAGGGMVTPTMLLAPESVNHRLLSGPVTMYCGLPPWFGPGYSVTTPLVVIMPIWLAPGSVNKIAIRAHGEADRAVAGRDRVLGDDPCRGDHPDLAGGAGW